MSHATLSADRLLDRLGVTQPSDLLLLEEIAWTCGALVKEGELEGAEARLVMNKGKGVITISSAIQDLRRKRFSIAHELGHFEMHQTQRQLSICNNEDITDLAGKQVRQKIEHEANNFASALLLPDRFFKLLCSKEIPSLSYISKLANEFATSLTSTSLRYLQFCNEPVAIVYSQDNYIRWFQGSKDFEETRSEYDFFIDVHAKLDPSTLAASLFLSESHQTKRMVRASSWFTPGKYRKDAKVVEYSMSMPNYDAVLTLLWVDEELDDGDDYLF
jgi:Zn-dependent peptidase ImmA (M78 family)